MMLYIQDGCVHPYRLEADPRDIDRFTKLDIAEQLEQSGYEQVAFETTVSSIGKPITVSDLWNLLCQHAERSETLAEGEVIGPYIVESAGRRICPPLAIGLWRTKGST